MYVNLAVADLLVTAVVMPQSMELIILDNLWIDVCFLRGGHSVRLLSNSRGF